MRNAVVIGATGMVGKAIARALANQGWRVVCVGRNADKLAALRREDSHLEVVAGSVGSDADAERTAEAVHGLVPWLDAAIVSINLPPVDARLLDTPAERLTDIFQGNLVSHHCAARAFLPRMRMGARYIGIGGGMADFTVPGAGAVSLCQAAQRNLYRFLAMETEGTGVSVLELMLFSHIADPTTAPDVNPRAIRADEVAAHLVAILDAPQTFPGPILTLKSRKQLGLPQRD